MGNEADISLLELFALEVYQLVKAASAKIYFCQT